ncbi:ribosome biogenesis GTP-binding protein YlqF [Neisseria bacilliformis ATCC BAA-1200]|uniref:Ribosome biogenesis GTP-binding protein YlqF n=1 Tax=Neisseria bacilliformis ATCC BAA-1200 TaxID=888742 RepID=F2BF69_9NEIS|nr:SMC-Scp complex subunit ScpB [Neisseria bacilliformis]EGF08941.1 ribosome biogenesis GTP-binding protein YlqF [Neisseria bacilliformis ATCC BAA-1200]QMT47003.1 SMC-Scp complex subunit ScpB [Neisseria bacilliformis]
MNDKLPPDALIEAALLTQPEPLGEKTLRQLCDPPLSQDKLIDVLGSLKARWHGRALQLAHTAEGWRFQTVPAAFERLGALQETRSPRYSRAVMETLAIIAYQQPVTRGDIEDIRGVAVSQNVMQTLLDRGWIETVGRRDTVGRPALWATTPAFLADLQLESLESLPPLTELGELVLPETAALPPAPDGEDADGDDADGTGRG